MSQYICFYCQLEHHDVEAGGVHYCPNRLCTGPGQATARMVHLKSFKNHADWGYTFDAKELVDLVTAAPHSDPLVREAEDRFLPKWRTRVEAEA